MAAITFTAFEPIRVADLGQLETYTTAVISGGRKGRVVALNATTGHADVINSTDIDIEVGALVGFISTKERSTLAVESCTVIREADVFVGETALSGLDFGDPVYLGDVDGNTADTAGTNTVIVGYVIPCYQGGLGTDKLLRVSTSHLAIPPTIPAA